VNEEVEKHEAGAYGQREIGPLHAHRERHGELHRCEPRLVDAGLQNDDEENDHNRCHHRRQDRPKCWHPADEEIETKMAALPKG
jgi:hypothetical protein